MYKPVQKDSSFLHRNFIVAFICVWAAGLIFGAAAAACLGKSNFSLMRTVLNSRVSIVSLLITAALPFLFTAYAVSVPAKGLLLFICFFKAYTFSFTGYLISAAFGTAGWLLQPLLQFTDLCTMPALMWFVISHCDKLGKLNRRDLTVSIVIAISAAVADCFVISPFLTEITDIL